MGNKGGMFMAQMLQINTTLESLDVGDTDLVSIIIIVITVIIIISYKYFSNKVEKQTMTFSYSDVMKRHKHCNQLIITVISFSRGWKPLIVVHVLFLTENRKSGCPGDGSELQHNAHSAQRQSSVTLQSTGGDDRPLRKHAKGTKRHRSPSLGPGRKHFRGAIHTPSLRFRMLSLIDTSQLLFAPHNYYRAVK